MRRALFKFFIFFIFFRGITGSTSSKLCHECGNSLLRVSWVGEQRRRGPWERGRERSEDAERSWRSINETLAGQSHRDAVLAVLRHCFQAWSAGLKAPQSGTFKTSFSGSLIYSRKKTKNGFGTISRKDAGDSSPSLPLAPLYRRAVAHFLPAWLRGVQLGRGEPSCLQRTYRKLFRICRWLLFGRFFQVSFSDASAMSFSKTV